MGGTTDVTSVFDWCSTFTYDTGESLEKLQKKKQKEKNDI
jgi:hypothetical protein